MSATPDFFSTPVYGQTLLLGPPDTFSTPGAAGTAPTQILPQTGLAPAGGLEVQRLIWTAYFGNATSPFGTPYSWGFMWAYVGPGTAVGTAGAIQVVMYDGYPVGGKFGSPAIIKFGDGEFVIPAGNALWLAHSFLGGGSANGLYAYAQGIGATG